MPQRFSPSAFAKRSSGLSRKRGKGLFNVSGVLFNTKEIEFLIDKKARMTFERIGKAMMRSAKRSLKLGERFSQISQIPQNDPWYMRQRQLARIAESRWMRGENPNPPLLPWKPSKPGKIPKIRSESSLLKKGILYFYEPHIKTLVVGGVRVAGTEGKVPSILEHGGMSGNFLIKKRGYIDKTLQRMRDSGRLQKMFARGMRV